MTEAQLDYYCRLVARGDFAAAECYMQACLAPDGKEGIGGVLSGERG